MNWSNGDSHDESSQLAFDLTTKKPINPTHAPAGERLFKHGRQWNLTLERSVRPPIEA